MPSAANGKPDKPASSEAQDNTPIRQVMTIIEHKIRNLEKRKGKLTQYRDLQKAGKELDKDQKVAVAKYDEVNQTLEFARDFSKQITQIAVAAERDAKKQAKKDAWVRYAADTNKIREVLLVLDCLIVMGTDEVREDFLNGTNGAPKLTNDDLRILDDLYPEVSPKHEPNEEGLPGFPAASAKAAEHLCSITEGKQKEVLGTTYARIKEIVTTIHESGYFDRVPEPPQPEPPQVEETEPEPEPEPQPQPQPQEQTEAITAPAVSEPVVPAGFAPIPVVPAPYPMRPLPPITLQEVEHAYFAHQYPQQRPIAEVIGSQNFFFLQESEIDSPNATPQPPLAQPSPPQQIPTQTYTNQHFIPDQMPPHFAPLPDHFPHPMHVMHRQIVNHVSPPAPQNFPPAVAPAPNSPPLIPTQAPPAPQPQPPREEQPTTNEDKVEDDWKESSSPPRDSTRAQGDGTGRFRRYGRGRGVSNGRGRGSFRGDRDNYRRNGDYQPRSERTEYQGRSEGYQGRKERNYDNYQGRYTSRNDDDGYYGNGEAGDARERSRDHIENGRDAREGRDTREGRDGFKGRGRGPRPSRPPRSHYRKDE